LGKLVVDGNLIEHSITYHMFGSIALVALLSVIVFRLSEMKLAERPTSVYTQALLAMALLIFLQILLGTQVREQVDMVAKSETNRSLWIDMLPLIFKIHRSCSLVILAFAIWLYMRSKSEPFIAQFRWAIIVLLAEILVGVVLAYLQMPAPAQPLHLLLGVLSFGLIFYAWLRARFSA
jgi:cytochrome c oxidase assembly protein subunit 15